MEENKKSASPKKTAAIEAIEAIERIALRGCGEGRGCLWYAILRWRFFLRLCGGGKMVVDGGFFGRMLKNGVKVWNFFVFFVILRD
ncbi:MAG: hypothetical protein PUE80_08160 [bacterium]|nr:hypothetical protein [bacterium]